MSSIASAYIKKEYTCSSAWFVYRSACCCTGPGFSANTISECTPVSEVCDACAHQSY